MTRFTKRIKINKINKILNVNKPAGISSYDVVRKVKRVLDFKKVGHGGTLDPFASGVLLVLIGRGATRQMENILTKPKKYQAVLKLGQKTDTGDIEGKIVAESDVPAITKADLVKAAAEFTGEYLQLPPQFSAKKVNGKPAYKYARKGIKVNLKPKKVDIYQLKIEQFSDDELIFDVDCSSGTYIRVLGEELAQTLGTVGHLTKLTRGAIGEYTLENSVSFDNIPEALQELKQEILTQFQKEVNING